MSPQTKEEDKVKGKWYHYTFFIMEKMCLYFKKKQSVSKGIQCFLISFFMHLYVFQNKIAIFQREDPESIIENKLKSNI